MEDRLPDIPGNTPHGEERVVKKKRRRLKRLKKHRNVEPDIRVNLN